MKSAVHACVWKTVASITDVDQKVWGDHAINCCYVLSGVDLRVKLFDNGQGPQPLSRHLLVAWTDTYWPISWFPLLQVFLYVSKTAWLDWKWLSRTSSSVWESVKTRKLMGDSLCSLIFMSDWQIKSSFEPIYFDAPSVTLVVRCHVGKEIAPNWCQCRWMNQ